MIPVQSKSRSSTMPRRTTRNAVAQDKTMTGLRNGKQEDNHQELVTRIMDRIFLK